MALFDTLLFVNLIAAMTWFGGPITGALLGSHVRAGGEVAPFARFCKAFPTVAGPLYGGASLVVLVTGAWLVALDGGPAFGDTWVVLALVGWLVSTILGATLVGLSWTRLAVALDQPGASIDGAEGLVSRAQRSVWLDAVVRTLVVLVVVWQPA